MDIYVDDATQYVAGNTLQDVEHILHDELQPITDRTSDNTVTKKAIFIGTKHQPGNT